MIGLGPPGRIRPWRLSSTVTALRAAFPGAKVHIRHYDPRAGFADFAVSEPVTITEESRELLSMTTSWGPRRLRVAAEILNACEHEEAVCDLVEARGPERRLPDLDSWRPRDAPPRLPPNRGAEHGQRRRPGARRDEGHRPQDARSVRSLPGSATIGERPATR